MMRRILFALALLAAAPAFAQSPPSGTASYVPDNTVSGTLGSLNAVVGPLFSTGEFGVALIIPAASTLAGTLTPYCSGDNVTYASTSFYPDATGSTVSTLTTVTSTYYAYGVVLTPGCRYVEVKATAYTSGTATATLLATQIGVVGNVVTGSVANDTTAIGNGLEVQPGVARATPTAITAGRSEKEQLSTTNGGQFMDLVGGAGTVVADVQPANTAALGNMLEVSPGVVRSAVAAQTAGRTAAVAIDAASGEQVINIGDGVAYNKATVQATNIAAPVAELAVAPAVAASAVAAATAGRGTTLLTDATTGMLLTNISDGASYLKAGVYANDTTALTNGLATFPGVAKASPTAVTAGRSEANQIDAASGGQYDVPVATTTAVGVSTGATDVNTATNIKASAGNVYGVSCVNNNASACFLQFYNTAGSPTCGTSVVWALALPTSGVLNIPPSIPLANHATGIAVCMGTTRTGATACTTANSCTIFYK
jgi:hypothetical protein